MNALILVDIQNDFLPGGALAVPAGNEVIPVANLLMRQADIIVANQDWHPPDHGSFAANHPGLHPRRCAAGGARVGPAATAACELSPVPC